MLKIGALGKDAYFLVIFGGRKALSLCDALATSDASGRGCLDQFLKTVKIIDGTAGMLAGFVAIRPRPGALV
jgi:hypothetical protein